MPRGFPPRFSIHHHSMKRCLNIDWLEVYCLESSDNYPHDAEFFRKAGWGVQEREYGTPMYKEMFTLIGGDEQPFLEVRRAPKSVMEGGGNGLFEPNSCHLRLTNRACYLPDCVQLLEQFLTTYGYTFSRISRIDLCLDFVRFDSGDDPHAFILRYMRGRYSKVNQARISAHGEDHWDGRDWNSLSWGQKKSHISTKLYCKSLELKQVKDKPYIRQQWRNAGLVDDDYNCMVRTDDGSWKPVDVYRLEFSIKSSVKNWFIMEDLSTDKKKLRSVRNDLPCYESMQQRLSIFFSLADHYFHFKKFKAGQRKDRCPDKVLFHPEEVVEWYRIESVATEGGRDRRIDQLLIRLYEYRDRCIEKRLKDACTALIESLEVQRRANHLLRPFADNELTAMRQVIAMRLADHQQPSNITLEQVRAQVDLFEDMFGEKY